MLFYVEVELTKRPRERKTTVHRYYVIAEDEAGASEAVFTDEFTHLVDDPKNPLECEQIRSVFVHPRPGQRTIQTNSVRR